MWRDQVIDVVGHHIYSIAPMHQFLKVVPRPVFAIGRSLTKAFDVTSVLILVT